MGRIAAMCGWALTVSVSALELREERGSVYDLEVSGRLVGVPAGEARFVAREDMETLGTETLRVAGIFGPGERELKVIWLEEVWAALPRENEADVLLAYCRDGYLAVYREDFIAAYRPFVILEIDGRGPDRWPPEGLKLNPAPWVIAVSGAVVPRVADLLDAGHKQPWGVMSIQVGRYAEVFEAIYTGRWSRLSLSAEAGREIWVNACTNCHTGPGGMIGGTKANRPFEVLAAQAGYNRDYFKAYVRNPQGTMPEAKMEAHPHYTDAQLEALIAFITAEGRP